MSIILRSPVISLRTSSVTVRDGGQNRQLSQKHRTTTVSEALSFDGGKKSVGVSARGKEREFGVTHVATGGPLVTGEEVEGGDRPTCHLSALEKVYMRAQGRIDTIVEENVAGIRTVGHRMKDLGSQLDGLHLSLNHAISDMNQVKRMSTQARRKLMGERQPVEKVPEASAAPEEPAAAAAAPVPGWIKRWLSAVVVVVALGGGSLPLAAPAEAFELPSPREWLQERKAKSAAFLLGPVETSKEALQQATALLADSPDVARMASLVRSAAKDCTPPEQSSVVGDMQKSLGVELCSFKLVLKNAASLLPDDDPRKVGASNALAELMASLQSLQTAVALGDGGLNTVGGALQKTEAALGRFESGIRSVLNVPPASP